MKLTRATQVELVGRGRLTLNPSDHIATGGEASVYRRAGTVIKLYTDPQKPRDPVMVDKLKRLAALNHEFVVAPRGLVLDGHGSPIGFYMDYVADGEALPRVFTNDFRARTGFGDAEASLLVDRMFRVMEFAHGQAAVLVDPNELNWTTVAHGGTGRDPRILDVDSWIVDGQRPAGSVMVMPSIRDWQTPHSVSPATDRFALAVVTFQVYAGIHPYKGTLDGYARNELERRMRDQASVFAPGVRLNHAVRDFGCIPSPLRDWYEATFQQGERTAPPSPLQAATTGPARTTRVARIITTASGSLRYERLFERAHDPASRIFPCGVVQFRSGQLFDLASRRLIAAGSDQCEVIRAGNDWIIADTDDGQLTFALVNGVSLQSQPLSLQLPGQQLVRYYVRLFAVTEQGLTELLLKRFSQPILAPGKAWQMMINSTRWFDGVGIQDAMGATFLIAPFGDDACAQVRVRELDGLRPVAAKAGHRFVSVIAADRAGNYRKIELAFDRTYRSYTVWQGAADSPELNMALLPKGVAATVVRDGELVIFVPSSGAVNRMPDKDITTTMLLGNWNDRVIYIRDGSVWSVRTA